MLSHQYTANIALKLTAYKPAKHEEVVLLRLLSAMFGRDMEFAASDGIQYQHASPEEPQRHLDCLPVDDVLATVRVVSVGFCTRLAPGKPSFCAEF